MAVQSKSMSLDTFLDALRFQESSHSDNPADGDNGNAYGPYQMWAIMVKECNDMCGTNYTHEDARDPEKAHDMATKLMGAFTKYLKGRGSQPTMTNLLMMWNGGRVAYRYNEMDPKDIPNYDAEKHANLDEYVRKFREEKLPYVMKLREGQQQSEQPSQTNSQPTKEEDK